MADSGENRPIHHTASWLMLTLPACQGRGGRSEGRGVKEADKLEEVNVKGRRRGEKEGDEAGKKDKRRKIEGKKMT